MSTTYNDYYDGSKIFLFLSTKIGLPIDLVNFLIAQMVALCVARFFRKPLKLASPEFRHSLCLIIGLLMGYFCFGKQAVHLSVLPMLSYTLLKTVPQHIMGNIILAASMLYLSCIHLHRQIYHTANYSLDITGPLMVITQRVTSLAYLLQDNYRTKEVNPNTSKKSDNDECRIEKIPSPLEYFSYTLAFQTLMCGPVVFYSDYISFIEGDRLNKEDEGKLIENEPSPRLAVLYKVAGSVGAALLYLSLAEKYPLSVLEGYFFILMTMYKEAFTKITMPYHYDGSKEPPYRYKDVDFLTMQNDLLQPETQITTYLSYYMCESNYAILIELQDPTSEVSRTWSALYLLWYAYLSTLVVRCKYYHAWLLSDAICNNSGMGFNGYDNNGSPKWDKMSNIDIFGFELAQNFRTAVASWNKNTNAWLRSAAYERGGAAWRTARVYALSALWHGFHPGYYLTFFAGGLFTVAAKKVRAFARPMFLESRPKKLLYDLLTFITTRVAMTYATVPFVLLHLSPSLAFYGKFYYSLHFIALGAMFLPAKSKSQVPSLNSSELLITSSKFTKDIPESAKNIEANGKLKTF